MRGAIGSILVVALGLVGCGDGASLVVQLKTDLRPGIDFVFTGARLQDQAGAELARNVRAANREDDFLDGLTVVEAGDVERGQLSVEVELLDADGEVLIDRLTRVQLERSLVVTVLVTGDCVGVSCPRPDGAPDLTECLSGECVSPECVAGEVDACPADVCEDDLDCRGVFAPCATGECIDGACLGRPDDAACLSDEYCDARAGCTPIRPSTCEDGAPCETGRACEVGAVQCVDGDAVCVATGVALSGTECRAAVDDCDVAETCDGVLPTCPVDGFAEVGTACAAGICDGLGGCAPCTPGAACSTGNPCERGAIACGDTATCEVAGPAEAGTPCREAVDVCDAAEACDGLSTSCPADAFLGSATECRASAGPCDAPESCDGSGPSCPADALFGAGRVCRPSAAPCDAAESCDGSGIACPPDVVESNGTVCRATAGPCDQPESCDGVGMGCPPDRFVTSGQCRASAGPCDVAESCDGSGPGCPTDGFATGGQCRGSAGPCDVAESCDGSGPGCPRDRFASGGQCRGSAGPCDVAESCDGSGPSCPPDGFRPNGSNCGATWQELSCGPFNVDYCQGGVCMRRGGFNSSNRPSCGTIGSLCGFSPGNCCGSGGYFCVAEAGNPIYGSSYDCAQCCRPGRCCLSGNPAGPCM